MWRRLAWLGMIALLCIQAVAWAVGEEDTLWQKDTYQKKVFEVGQRLIQANGITTKISFRYSKSTSPNAMANGNLNTIYVTHDLLEYISSDDELAAILGHEMTHILRHHQAKRDAKSSLLAGLYTGILSSMSNTPSPYYYFNRGYLYRNKYPVLTPNVIDSHMGIFKQKYETEADLGGIDLMVRAGYNPLAMEQSQMFLAGDGTEHWVDHPRGTPRITDIRHYIANHYPQFLTPELLTDWKSDKPTMSSTAYYLPPTTPPAATVENIAPDLTEQAEQLKAANSLPSVPVQANPLSIAQADSVHAIFKNQVKPKGDPVAPIVSAQSTPATTIETATATVSSPMTLLAVANTTTTGATAQPSLLETVLTLNPDQMKVFKAIEQKNGMTRAEIEASCLNTLSRDEQERMLSLLVQKNLVRVVGSAPDELYVLSDWSLQALKGVGQPMPHPDTISPNQTVTSKTPGIKHPHQRLDADAEMP